MGKGKLKHASQQIDLGKLGILFPAKLMYVDVCKHKHLERARTRTAKLAAHRDVQSKKHWQFLHK